MRQKTISVYSFNELSGEAKLNAMAKYMPDYFWSSDNEKSLREFEKTFPIKIKNYEYGYRKYISFDFTESEEVESLTGFRLSKYIWNNYGSVLFKGKYYGKLVYDVPKSKEYPIGARHLKRYSRVLKETSCVLTGYHIDDYLLNPIYEFLKKPADNVNFLDLMESCLNSWLDACERDFEWRQSEEYFAEHCEANNYEFDERGNLI